MVRYSFLVRLSHPLLHAGLSRRLFDHLVRPRQHTRGIVRPICFAALRLMMNSNFVGCSHRQIGGFGSFQDLVHVNSRAPVEVSVVRPVVHEAAGIDKLLLWVNSRQPVFAGKLDDPLSFGEKGARVVVIIAPTCFCFAV